MTDETTSSEGTEDTQNESPPGTDETDETTGEAPETSSPDVLAVAVEALEGLTDAVESLSALDDESSRPQLEELAGGTFTVSSVGMFGGMFTTPIINYPEVAILGVGEAKDRVLVKDGKFYAGKLMPLSLSCDHRVVDGAEGARFLRTLAGLLEQPDTLVK